MAVMPSSSRARPNWVGSRRLAAIFRPEASGRGAGGVLVAGGGASRRRSAYRISSMERRASSQAVRRRAVQFLADALATAGFQIELAPPGFLSELMVRRGGKNFLVKVLAASAPHRRGGTGSLGLQCILGETAADFVALADLSRLRGWLLPVEDFKRGAQPLTGNRDHLDWIVVPLGKYRSQVASENAYDRFLIESTNH